MSSAPNVISIGSAVLAVPTHSSRHREGTTFGGEYVGPSSHARTVQSYICNPLKARASIYNPFYLSNVGSMLDPSIPVMKVALRQIHLSPLQNKHCRRSLSIINLHYKRSPNAKFFRYTSEHIDNSSIVFVADFVSNICVVLYYKPNKRSIIDKYRISPRAS